MYQYIRLNKVSTKETESSDDSRMDRRDKSKIYSVKCNLIRMTGQQNEDDVNL